MSVEITEGDILDQSVDVIVNSWNRNIIPWWLLLPQRVSGAIKRRAGLQPFRELSKMGPMALGSAVETSAGKLRFKSIIHVAGINMWWQSSEFSIRQSVQSAMQIVNAQGYRSVAFPLIGAGSGSFNTRKARPWAQAIMQDTLEKLNFDAKVCIVVYNR